MLLEICKAKKYAADFQLEFQQQSIMGCSI